MSTERPDAELALEQATLELFRELGWHTVNAYHETYTEDPGLSGGGASLGRTTRSEVILRPRLLAALARLNPDLPPESFAQACDELARDRSAMTPAAANREIHAYLKDGLPVAARDTSGEERPERLRLIDWDEPDNNDWLLVQQLWVTGDLYTRRTS